MNTEQELKELSGLLDEYFVVRGYDTPGLDWETYPGLGEEVDEVEEGQ